MIYTCILIGFIHVRKETDDEEVYILQYITLFGVKNSLVGQVQISVK